MAASKPTSWLSGHHDFLSHLVRTWGPYLTVWAVSLSSTKLIPRTLTPTHFTRGIRSLIGIGNLCGPLTHSVLYLHEPTREASPKAISGRTSYRRVRLAFHHYPQLILQLFTAERFGPSRGLTLASPWPWVDHPVSGLQHATYRPFKTRFRCGYGPKALNLAAHRNSPAHSPKGTPSSPKGLRRLVSTRFQVLFHSAPAVLFTFPSRY